MIWFFIKALAAIRKYYALLFLVAFGYITYALVRNYFTGIYFTHSQEFYKTGTKELGAIMGVRYSTRKAFLPKEPIKIEIRIRLYDPALIDHFSKNTSIGLSLKGAFFTDDDINNNQVSKKISEKELYKEFDQFAMVINTAVIRLRQRDYEKSIYEGQGEVYFQREGEFSGHILELYNGELDSERSIKIGSPTDLLNKKTNELVFWVAILGVLIPLYFELKRRVAKN